MPEPKQNKKPVADQKGVTEDMISSSPKDPFTIALDAYDIAAKKDEAAYRAEKVAQKTFDETLNVASKTPHPKPDDLYPAPPNFASKETLEADRKAYQAQNINAVASEKFVDAFAKFQEQNNVLDEKSNTLMGFAHVNNETFDKANMSEKLALTKASNEKLQQIVAHSQQHADALHTIDDEFKGSGLPPKPVDKDKDVKDTGKTGGR